jgi:hypothetical protein
MRPALEIMDKFSVLSIVLGVGSESGQRWGSIRQ